MPLLRPGTAGSWRVIRALRSRLVSIPFARTARDTMRRVHEFRRLRRLHTARRLARWAYNRQMFTTQRF